MPKIRSITTFTTIDPARLDLTLIGRFAHAATQALAATGYVVQTRRLATQPFPQWSQPATIVSTSRNLYSLCREQGLEYLSIGPLSMTDDPAYLQALPQIFAQELGIFATTIIATPQQGIGFLHETARLIDTISRLKSHGMLNLYLAALANCPAGSPFFPVAYHGGGEPSFALAIQAADLAVQAFSHATDPTDARQRLTTAIQSTTDTLLPVAEKLARDYGIRFGGFDFSLAPYPVNAESLGGALEALGPTFGGNGLVASASVVMNAVEAADFPRAGFSGLMLPILEDSVLAARAAQGRLSINDLLLLSAVCGTGLDCVPLPGDVGETTLHDILLDVAALSLRLNKPLTARLMPFPGKQAGDSLTFDFEYFADSRVLPAPRAGHWRGKNFNVLPRP
ncbi:MAG: DUF711 family protein [Anaerolineales bacterium]|nr:DUF711 family protein [Anaerolineales bacterium]